MRLGMQMYAKRPHGHHKRPKEVKQSVWSKLVKKVKNVFKKP